MPGTGQVPLTDEELANLYKTGMEDDFYILEELLEQLKACSGKEFDAIDKARGIVHNIKGQGASFGFPLMTQIGVTFYSLLQHQVGQEDIHVSTSKLYGAHLTAMKSIIANEIRGDGPELLQKVAASLKEKVDIITH